MSQVVTVTGGSGFVGQLVRAGLAAEGFDVRNLDRLRGPVVDVLRRRYLASGSSRVSGRVARTVRVAQSKTEKALLRTGVVKPTADDILAPREELATLFAGSNAVVHLAGIPHPHWPGATVDDFVRVNYDGAVNVFEAARDAGAEVFVFASSAQVYPVNNPVRLDRLPIAESAYLPLPSEGQTAYGFLKGAFERYLAGACERGPTRAVSLRLEYPGMRPSWPGNHYIGTSVENLVQGFTCAVRGSEELRFEEFNLADAEVDPRVVDIQAYIRHRWPYVRNDTVGNECLMDTEKARRLLGYRPVRDGRYVNPAAVW